MLYYRCLLSDVNAPEPPLVAIYHHQVHRVTEISPKKFGVHAFDTSVQPMATLFGSLEEIMSKGLASWNLQRAIIITDLVNWPGRATAHKPIDLNPEHLSAGVKIDMECYKNSTHDLDINLPPGLSLQPFFPPSSGSTWRLPSRHSCQVHIPRVYTYHAVPAPRHVLTGKEPVFQQIAGPMMRWIQYSEHTSELHRYNTLDDLDECAAPPQPGPCAPSATARLSPAPIYTVRCGRRLVAREARPALSALPALSAPPSSAHWQSRL